MAPSAAGTYVGLMSGTSLDAVDAVVLRIQGSGQGQVAGGASVDIPAALRAELLALNTPGHDELGRAAQASSQLARLYALAVQNALEATGLAASDICALGAHGQTVRHRPDLGYTIQLNAPALLAELTGIDVIADFRSRDMAAGGQGAPLVPAFHAAQFPPNGTRVVLNLGGIANITVLDADGTIRGFDTGPANMLMDAWVRRHRQLAFDTNGEWAASGHPLPLLLQSMLEDPWFAMPPPKSTGRDDFNEAWLIGKLRACYGTEKERWPKAVDIQATLLQLTVRSVATAIRQYASEAREVLACGGGAKNTVLMAALQSALPCPVETTDHYGLPAQWVEAAAFAWLAWCYDNARQAGLPAVTGARRPTVLGCRHLA